MRTLITGGNGFFGSHLAAGFRQRGHSVTTTVRRPSGPDERAFALGEPFDPALPCGFDAVIHNAHDVHSAERTLAGTRALFEAARACEPRPRQLFVGSYSARADAVSEYGQVKYALERMFLDAGEMVIRPGLIAGPGGLFGRNVRTILRSPLIPLIDGGRDQVPIVSVRDAVAAASIVLESGKAGAWNLFHPDMPTMRQIVEEVARQAGLRRIVVPLPLNMAIAASTFAARLRLPLPFRPDSLRSIRANRTPIHESDLRQLTGRAPEDLRCAVQAALMEIGRAASAGAG